MVTQITPSQSFEVHPYCGNDANKGNDKADPQFSFHVSHGTRTTAPFLRTVLNGCWLQRVSQLALKIKVFPFFFFYRERSGNWSKWEKAGKGLFGVRNTFQRLPPPKNSLRNLRWNQLIKRHMVINNATRGNNMKDLFISVWIGKGEGSDENVWRFSSVGL